MFRKFFFGLFLFVGLTGCNLLSVERLQQSVNVQQIKKSVVPDELKEYAKNALDYGDYYMKEYVDYVKSNNEDASQNSIKTGAELTREESDKSNKISERLLPKLDKETENLAKQCNKTLFAYSANYFLLHSGIFNNTLPFSESQSIDQRWKEVIKSRGEMIKDCQLDS